MNQPTPSTFAITGNRNMGYELIYLMDDYDPEEKYRLIDLLVENKCHIKPLLWRSKYDKTVVTDTQPIIYDVYNCVIQARGDIHRLTNAIYLYQKRLDQISYLERCFGDGSIKCIDQERENNPIEYERLANLILASLFHP